MKWKLYFYGKLMLICIFASTQCSFSQQVPRSLTAQNGTFIGFYEFKPLDYDANPSAKYPLIIFLHGIGERGDGKGQLPYVLANAIPKYINQGSPMRFYVNGQWQSFIVLSPQLSQMYGSWQNFYVDEMLRYAKQHLRVDTNRMFLTGLSLGGGGVWKYSTNSVDNAKQFAAVAPVCGTCDWSNVCNLAQANTPVWAFHAQDDGIVGVGCTTGAIGMLKQCNPPVPPLMTIYPTGNHFIWDKAYDTAHTWQNPNIYEWFLSKSRSSVALPPNIPPIANAGPNQTITIPANAVTLNASASSDPDGYIMAYSWTKISGPAQFNIASPNSAITTVNNLVAGTYVFQLSVTDNRGAVSSADVTITVNAPPPGTNLPPIAKAGSDVTINVNNYLLNSWGSYDPDGKIVAYLWKKIAGPAQYTITGDIYATANVTNLVNGTYAFELTVTDNQGATGKDTVHITVALPNLPPVANAGSDQTIALPANSATLNGTASSDPDGTIVSYSWTKVNGPASFNIANAVAATTTVNNLAQGIYQFKLTVTDNSGATSSAIVTITVNAATPPPNKPPVANAGGNQAITLPTNMVTLNGSGSSDPDGTIVTYAWSKISGPASFNIANAGSVSTTVNNLVQGAYQFRLAVTDDSGATTADTVLITVNAAVPPPNKPPVANAGPDQAITLPVNSITLNGTASYDPDGTIVGYSWTKINGPSSFNIANAVASTTVVNNLVQGVYQFSLAVTDNSGATTADTVLITVNAAVPPPNKPPIANAGPDQAITLPVNSVTLNGSASYDPDGTISTYAWSKISGPSSFNIVNAGSVSASVNNLVEGVYQFMLTVTDNSGASASATVAITVKAVPPPKIPPVANAGSDQSITLPANSITLNGNGSTGTIVSYAWSKISGPASFNIMNAAGVSTTVNNLVQGIYQFKLTVTDNTGAISSASVNITVNAAPPPPNIPPVANAGPDQTITLPVNSVTLNGSGSSDADGTIVTYAWSKVSGPASFSISNAGNVTTAVNNLVQGVYQFRLAVTDNSGATTADTVVITVNPRPNQPPVSNPGANQTITLPVNSVVLNGSGSYDPDGSIAYYSWSRLSGPGGITILGATTPNATITGLTVGEYIIRLMVTDNDGATGLADVKITVLPMPNQLPVANAGKDTTIAFPSTTGWLNGTASYDPDGTIISYQWRQITGPGGAIIQNASQPITQVNNLVPGDYLFELAVTDNNGGIGKDSMWMSVVNNFRYEESLTIYPNPVINHAHIRCVSDSTGKLLLRILDMTGTMVHVIEALKGQSQFDQDMQFPMLKPGAYYLEAIIGNKKRMIIKFIRQ